MNTRMSYMYRDADNYKTHHDEVLSGEITQQQLMTIVDCLDDKTYFIPHQLGLPEIRFDQVTESDHCWFELCPEQDFSSTNDEPTIDITVDELVERFQKAKGHWDEETFSNYAAAMLGEEEDDGQYIIAVETVIQYFEGIIVLVGLFYSGKMRCRKKSVTLSKKVTRKTASMCSSQKTKSNKEE